jgi:hypothetical protein
MTFRLLLWLVALVLSLALVIGLLGLFPRAASLSGEWLIAFGALAILAASIPILRLAMSPLAKAIAFTAYVCACAVAMFVTGWAAIGVFGIARMP